MADQFAMPTIDLRSDTVSWPTPEMRAALASAPVGDDVYGEDPTVNQLEAEGAALLGKEAGLFVASGSMGNLAAILTHCARGDEMIVGKQAHIFRYEAGSAAALGSVHPYTIEVQPDGTLPLDAIREAIRLNRAAVDGNLRAFDIGRWAVARPQDAAALLHPEAPARGPDPVAHRAARLTAYQNKRLTKRFLALVNTVQDPALRDAVAQGYHKLLAYKDEYEVARLHRDPAFAARIARDFGPDARLTYHLAPPLLPGRDGRGRPRKRRFPGWAMGPAFALLSRMKGLRGTVLDPFGHTAERRMERNLIPWFEGVIGQAATLARSDRRNDALRVLQAPMGMRGFGPVKRAAVERVQVEVAALLRDQTQV